MIGKIIIGKGFKGCIGYCLSPKRGKNIERAEVIDYNLCFGNKNDLIKQFTEVRLLNPRLKKPVMHFIVSLPNTDRVDNNILRDIGKSLSEDFGFHDRQYLVIRHFDTEDTHPHIHIIANRQGLDADSKVVSDSNSYERIAKFCRKMEQKFNLTQVQSPNKFLPMEERVERHDKRRLTIIEGIKKSLEKSCTIPEFNENIKNLGLKVKVGRGITFFDDKISVKGSELGYSLEKIRSRIQQNLLRQSIINKKQNLGL